MGDPGKAPAPPLFSVQTEAPRAKKKFLETGHPRLFEGLDRKERVGEGGGGGLMNYGP